MSTYLNTLPAQVATTIYQGIPWEGVQVGYFDADEAPEEVEVTAAVATATVAEGGTWLADCDVSEQDENGYYTVSLDGTATEALPARRVLIDVKALRDGEDEARLAMRISAQVESRLPDEPVGP